jgi:hypothetical protein
MKINAGGKTIDAVAIYTGGRTGPKAAAGEQILDAVPLDANLADTIAAIIRQAGLARPLKRKAALRNAALAPAAPQFVPLQSIGNQPGAEARAVSSGVSRQV